MDIIESAIENGEISHDDAELLRNICENASESIVGLKDQSKELQKKCSKYENDILQAKLNLEQIKIQESDEIVALNKIDELRGTLHKDLETIEQNEIISRFELQEVKLAYEELTATLERVKRDNLATIEPILTNLSNQKTEFETQLANTLTIIDNETTIKHQLERKLQFLIQHNTEKSVQLHKKREEFKHLETDPKQLQIKHETADKTIINLENDIKIHNSKNDTFDQEKNKLMTRKLENDMKFTTFQSKVNNIMELISSREKEMLGIQTQLEENKTKHHDMLTKKIEINVTKKEIESDLRYYNSQYHIIKRECDDAERRYKKKLVILNQTKELIPTLEDTIKNTKLELELKTKEYEALNQEVDSLKEGVDDTMMEFYKKEKVELAKKSELDVVCDDVDDLEEEVMQLIFENKRLSSLITSLFIQRDKRSRDKLKLENKVLEIQEMCGIKELMVVDITKRVHDVSNRLKEFLALYEVVKNERNKLINLIQGNNQGLIEMNEKVKLVLNEMEILGNEIHSKDQALTKEKAAYTTEKSLRDNLQHDINTNISDSKAKQAILESYILEIEKHNNLIQDYEKEILMYKNQYEEIIQERNKLGIQLIDRNDELTVLYEKLNNQKSMLKRGEVELMNRTNELRLLRIQTEELQSKHDILKKKIPIKSINDTKIEELEQRLYDEKDKMNKLSIQLETPDNISRWRPLEGEDPPLEDLVKKIEVLEKRVDRKRDEILEKEMIIDELKTLNVKIQNQIDIKNEPSKKLSEQLRDVQVKLKDITRRMMASVSELSMYQSIALQLEQEKLEKEKVVEAARLQVTNGEPPTEEAMKDWARLERQMQIAKAKLDDSTKMYNTYNSYSDTGMMGQTLTANTLLLKTTAENRPTAYIPDDLLGVPKPYGNSAPFKPTTAGASMRYIRNPVPKPIEL